jgi:hypothetical protein
MLGNNNAMSGKLFSLKIKTKEDGKKIDPCFVISEKIDDKWVHGTKKCTQVAGTIRKIVHGQYEWEGELVDTVTLYLEDKEADDGNGEIYKIDFSYNILSKSVFNSLLGIKDMSGVVTISLYKNKSGYPAASVKLNDEKVDWAYRLEDLPEAPKVKFKGKEMTDYTEVDAFFRNALKEKFSSFSSTKGESSHSDGEGAQGATVGQGTLIPDDKIDYDDIPF